MTPVFIFTLKSIFGFVIFVIFIFFAVLSLVLSWIESFKRWKKTGFCMHDWEKEQSTLYGAKNWHRCKTCKTRRYF